MGSSLILILALGRQGQIELCDFQASQDFIVRPCHKKNKRKLKRKEEEEEAGGRRGWGGGGGGKKEEGSDKPSLDS